MDYLTQIKPVIYNFLLEKYSKETSNKIINIFSDELLKSIVKINTLKNISDISNIKHKSDLEKLKITDIKTLLKQKSEKIIGNKNELIDRLYKCLTEKKETEGKKETEVKKVPEVKKETDVKKDEIEIEIEIDIDELHKYSFVELVKIAEKIGLSGRDSKDVLIQKISQVLWKYNKDSNELINIIKAHDVDKIDTNVMYKKLVLKEIINQNWINQQKDIIFQYLKRKDIHNLILTYIGYIPYEDNFLLAINYDIEEQDKLSHGCFFLIINVESDFINSCNRKIIYYEDDFNRKLRNKFNTPLEDSLSINYVMEQFKGIINIWNM